ncbi:hypothetical protein MRX96_032664 [Rhipicephalus microplus]
MAATMELATLRSSCALQISVPPVTAVLIFDGSQLFLVKKLTLWCETAARRRRFRRYFASPSRKFVRPNHDGIRGLRSHLSDGGLEGLSRKSSPTLGSETSGFAPRAAPDCFFGLRE